MYFPGFGYNIFGNSLFTELKNIPVVQSIPGEAGNPRTQPGFKTMGNRGYSWPDFFQFLPISESDEIASIQIYTVSGAFIGKIRTDSQKTIVESVEFTNQKNGGCSNFRLVLNKLPEFPIEPFSTIRITIGQTNFVWYAGIVDYPDGFGAKKQFYSFKGVGFQTYLSKLTAEGTYSAGLDIGEVVDSIIQNSVSPYSPIKYNAEKIERNTGKVLINDIELGKSKIDKDLQMFADMTGCCWGVDGDQDAYFEKLQDPSEFKKTFFIGYDLNDFAPVYNLENVRNSIIVLREKGKSEGGSGWIVAGVYNDETSQKKYKKRELEYQIPGYFEQEESDIIGNALLEDKKEPKPSGKFDRISVIDGNDYLERGNYRIILPHDKFDFVFDPVDNPLEWDEYISGDLVVSKDETFFVYADGSVKLTFSDAIGDRIELVKTTKEKINKIRVFLRANRTGKYLKIGFGITNWNEYTFDIDFSIKDLFFNFDWDISDLNIREINKFGFQIIDEVAGETNVYIDKIEMEANGNRFFILPLESVKYKFTTKDSFASGEFGILPAKMEDWLSGLFTTVNELKFVNEVK